jgi:hypothetical protein
LYWPGHSGETRLSKPEEEELLCKFVMIENKDKIILKFTNFIVKGWFTSSVLYSLSHWQ